MDIDTLYQSVVPYLNNEVLPLRIPVLGITMKIGKQQVDALYRYIKEA